MRGPVPRWLTLLVVAGALAGCAAQPAVGGYEPLALPGAASKTAASPAARAPGEVVLAIAGDVHFAERTTKLLDDPASAFGPVTAVFTAADLAVVNLETAVTTRGTAEP